MAIDIKVGDIWTYKECCFRRVMDLIDTGIDQIVYWKDQDRCTGRSIFQDFENWTALRRAKMTKRQSEKGFRLEHNERFKKCGNYAIQDVNLALGSAGLQTQSVPEPLPQSTMDTSTISTPPPTETSAARTTPSNAGLTGMELLRERIREMEDALGEWHANGGGEQSE